MTRVCSSLAFTWPIEVIKHQVHVFLLFNLQVVYNFYVLVHFYFYMGVCLTTKCSWFGETCQVLITYMLWLSCSWMCAKVWITNTSSASRCLWLTSWWWIFFYNLGQFMTICWIKSVTASRHLLKCVILLKIIVWILYWAKSTSLCIWCLDWSRKTSFISFMPWSNLLSHTRSNIKVYIWVVHMDSCCTSSNTYTIVLYIELVFLLVKIILSKCKSRHVFVC